MAPTAPTTIDAYIATHPADVQAILHEIRRIVRETAPDAQETIKYGMPTFMLRGRNLVYFAANKRHIGFYPAPVGVDEFKDDVDRYGFGRGTLRFPYVAPVPQELIGRVVGYWAARIRNKVEAKT